MSDFVNILRTELRPFDYTYHNQVRSSAGLYSFWVRGRCIYVGMSRDLKRRIEEHAKNESNKGLKERVKAYRNDVQISVAYLNQDARNLRRSEAMAIRELRPIANNTISVVPHLD